MRRALLLTALLAMLGGMAGEASAHLVKNCGKLNTQHAIHKCQESNLAHAKGAVRFLENRHKRGTPDYQWHKKAVKWISREMQPVRPAYSVGYWASIQIYYATLIGRSAGSDPWPNCPDPIWNGASWFDTVRCENGGNWLDSPGYYRCGLQFAPSWEAHYGRKFCP